MTLPKQKQCCVRLPERLHRQAKLEAYHNGMTLQDWLTDLIEKNIFLAKGHKVTLSSEINYKGKTIKPSPFEESPIDSLHPQID